MNISYIHNILNNYHFSQILFEIDSKNIRKRYEIYLTHLTPKLS